MTRHVLKLSTVLKTLWPVCSLCAVQLHLLGSHIHHFRASWPSLCSVCLQNAPPIDNPTNSQVSLLDFTKMCSKIQTKGMLSIILVYDISHSHMENQTRDLESNWEQLDYPLYISDLQAHLAGSAIPIYRTFP